LFKRPQTPEGARIFPGSQTLPGEISNGVARTVLGLRPAEGLPDGKAAIVLRSGALSAQQDDAGAFRVVDVRFAGPGWTVRFETGDGAHLQAAMEAAPGEGARIAVSADWSNAFLFSLAK